MKHVLHNNIVELSGGYFLVDKKLSGCGCIQKLRVRVFFHYSFFLFVSVEKKLTMMDKFQVDGLSLKSVFVFLFWKRILM